MKKVVLVVLVALTFNFLYPQKLVKKTLINPQTRYIEIDVTNCFELNVSTSANDHLQVAATIDGEYSKDLIVKIVEEGSTIGIKTDFRPNFVNPNDKLSAHKVVSIALNITLPEHKGVKIHGGSCNVVAQGLYNNLEVILNDGFCIINSVSENTNVSTKSGSITLSCDRGEIQAKSKYGKVIGDSIPRGGNTFVLNSITGHINLKKL